ncbi:SusC/RagA family TonB-linked outer membrane protein [Hymenobacter arizonensis]|uniref:TonB-linked outer membrane protein, SusC/RagA family n=1 Tax=Hymenobacter arizonensis TaxID=1227077 RepID=A0A1I6BJD8_HYMAR|nr:TonB-dependent receptor [Hymenobacter arizonensis]SFQ81043.1 TonB-linked outer membrane protein, SusC/RagA family [Hymenobacter arizonensis]
MNSSLTGFWKVGLLILSLFFPFAPAWAQTKQTVAGTVVDASNQPLPGVTVLVKNTTNGTSTGPDGTFTLTVATDNPILVLSYIGFKSQEVPVSGRSQLNLSMVGDEQALKEVVVVGYGTQEKKDLTGAITTVSGQDVARVPVSGFDQALQGQVAGLQISSSSGSPGGNTSILIRGVGSVTGGNEPLFVIDGFPVSGAGGGNPLNTINPNDIESIDVLKDASATAIYGSRGSNGVIIVTTKRGKAGKSQIGLDVYAGYQEISKKLEMMNAQEFALFTIDARNNGYLDNTPSTPTFTPRITDPNSVRPTNFRIPTSLLDPASLGEGTDWQDAIFRKARIQSYQVSASGGGDNVRFGVSAGYFDQQGIVLNTGLQRYSVRANVDADVAKRLRVGVSLLPSYTRQQDLPYTGHYGSFGVIQAALAQPPNVPVYNPDGSYGTSVPAPDAQSVSVQSAVKIANEYKNPSTQFRLLGNTYAEYALLPELKFRTTLGADLNFFRSQIWIPSTLNTAAATGPALAVARRAESISWLNENTLNYQRTFGQHAVNVVGGFTAQQEMSDAIAITANNFPDDLVPNINGGIVVGGANQGGNDPAGRFQDYTILSLLARANYVFMDRYLLTATIRRDGSSRFGDNNKWGTFPSASLGWRVSEEAFLKQQNVINDLKLRASYGLTGNNAIGNYRAIGQLGNSNYIVGDALTPGLVRSSFSNPNLGWETMKQLDLGLDLAVLNSRVIFTADVYDKRNSNMLFNIQVPGATGLTNAVVNLGEVQNRGLEMALTTRNFVGDFKWTTNANITFNRNKVLALSTDAERIFASANGQTANSNVTMVGQPIGVFFGRRQLGIFQTDAEATEYGAQPLARAGDVKWKDSDGNRVINDNDREVIGNPHPKYFFGFNNTFAYKAFSLDIMTNGMVGFDVYNGTFMLNNSGVQNNTKYVYDNRWISASQPGDGRFGRSIRGGRNNNAQYSSQYIFDGSYLRIRTVTLAYTLPAEFSRSIGLQGARVFATGANLLTFTNYPGYDPEASTAGDNLLAPRSDFGSYPIARSYTAGVSVSF